MQLAEVYRYVEEVIDGRQIACRYVRRACERFRHDLEHGHERGLRFDEALAQWALDFFPANLRHWDGDLAGQPFELDPWEAFIQANVYGWIREDTGARRFRTIYNEVARKNGKTSYIGGNGLLLLTSDGESGAQIYSAATKREQANISHRAARHMVRKSPALRAILQVTPRVEGPRSNTGSIYYPAADSFWKVLGRDSHTEDGLNVHAALIDEFHAHKDRGMADILETAMGARSQPLAWYITTAGSDVTGPCYAFRQYAISVLDGFDRADGMKDDAVFAIIFTLDGHDEAGESRDDPFDERVWIKANPGLGSAKKIDNMRDAARKARHSPAALNGFLTKELNVWVRQAVAWMPMVHWRGTPARIVTLEALRGRECWGGLDLASTSDTCGLVLVSPSTDPRFRLDVWCRFYVPDDAVKNCHENARASTHYPLWAEQGWLTVTPGNRTDYDFIEADLLGAPDGREGIAATVDLRKLAVDKWNSSHLVNHLTDEGLPVYGYPQTYAGMTEACKQLEMMVLAHELNHGLNPVLTWQAGNVRVARDEQGNMKPVREKSTQKIDGIVALLMAIGCWHQDTDTSTPQDTGELMVI